MTQMSQMSMVPSFMGSVTQQQMFAQFALLQQQQQMLLQQQAAAQQQLVAQQQQQQQQQRAKATSTMGGRRSANFASRAARQQAAPPNPSGPYANGAMDDAFSSMVASQAQACAPRPAKAAPSDDSLHATDLDAAKMLGSYAFNAVRAITMFRRRKK